VGHDGRPIGFARAHFTAFQKERLGWLNAGVSPPITTVVSDGTYTLETYESAGSGPKALKILKSTDPSTGKRTWYYVESRQAIGFDAFLATDWYTASNTNVLTASFSIPGPSRVATAATCRSDAGHR
jgi:hypothetical protein